MSENMLLATATSFLFSVQLFRKCSKNKRKLIECRQIFSYHLPKTYWLLRNHFFFSSIFFFYKFVFCVSQVWDCSNPWNLSLWVETKSKRLYSAFPIFLSTLFSELIFIWSVDEKAARCTMYFKEMYLHIIFLHNRFFLLFIVSIFAVLINMFFKFRKS